MTTAHDPFEKVTYEHVVGQFVDCKPGWWVFTHLVDADDGRMVMDETGPFASKEAATVCADMASEQGVEDIDAAMLRAARLAYMTRTTT